MPYIKHILKEFLICKTWAFKHHMTGICTPVVSGTELDFDVLALVVDNTGSVPTLTLIKYKYNWLT